MAYRSCGRPDIIQSFGVNCESVIGNGAGEEDGGRAAIEWLVEQTSPTDDICGDAEAVMSRPDDPFRRQGETVVITVAGSTTKHVVDFGPSPGYKIVKWRVVLA